LQAVLQAWERRELYAQVWIELHQSGLRAPPPEVCRQQLRQHTQNENKERHHDRCNRTNSPCPPGGDQR
jgi:hypothetical protein